MAYKKPKKNLSRGYRSTNNQVIEGYTGGEGGPHPDYSSKKKTILFGYFATNKNNKVPEGWRGGEGPVIPPPYTGPKSSFTRAYYSPNIEAYELGWRGGYGFQQHIDYFKNAIALATIFVNNKSGVNRPKQAVSTTVNLTRTTNGFLHVKFAIALQTSAIVSRYIRSKIKTAIVNYVGVVASKQRFDRIRFAFATRVLLIKSNKTRVALIKPVFINIANYKQLSRFKRAAKALTTNIAFDGKISAFHRYGTARITHLITTTKKSKFIRAAKANQLNVAIATRFVVAKRLAKANQVMLSKISKNYGKNIKVILAELAKTTKTAKFTRRATATIVNIAVTSKLSRFIRVAKATAISIVSDSKIDQFYRYAVARVVNLAQTTKLSKFTRKANANRTNLARVNKRRSTFVKALVTNLSTNIKSHAYRKIAKNITIFIGNIGAGKNNKKSAIVLQSVSATVTKANNRKKYATATVSYEIGTKKSITYFRRAIATAVSLVRYGISMVINVRSIESAKVEPVNEVNFYVTPHNVDVAGDHATENDQVADYAEPTNEPGALRTEENNQTAPYSEPLYNSGEDVVPS